MGVTYSQASAAARQHPTDAKAAALVETVFKGTMLQSSLLQAWGWGQVGDYAALGLWVLAALALVTLLAIVFELSVAPRSLRTALK
jgi:membrane protein YdbS with pleckstrin-like domain